MRMGKFQQFESMYLLLTNGVFHFFPFFSSVMLFFLGVLDEITPVIQKRHTLLETGSWPQWAASENRSSQKGYVIFQGGQAVTLLETNISHPMVVGKMSFLLLWWNVLVPWRFFSGVG